VSADYILGVLGLIVISAILAMSVNLVMGYGGIMTVSHGASMGVGAYVTGSLAVQLGWDTALTVPLGALGAGAVGWLFMVLAAQLDPDDFILASFAFQMVVVDLFTRWTPVTGGPAGLFGIDRPSLFGYTFDDSTPFTIGLVVIGVLAAVVLLHIGRSGYAITLRGIRESPRSVEATGHSVFRKNTVAWAVSCGFAGLAGGLYAITVGIITPADFDVQRSILAVAFLLVGGIGNMSGAITGAFALMIVPEIVKNIDAIPNQWQGPGQQILYGVVIVLFVWFRPQGILPERPVLRLRPRTPRRRGRTDAPAPSTPERVTVDAAAE
jgi:branched-chain amino acid transport system permease protein